jgi:hypothetical protein
VCLAGASGAGAEVLQALASKELRAYFVWVPMLPPDSSDAARAAEQRFAEPRASHYWDRERYVAKYMARALGIDSRPSATAGDVPQFAWDVYLAFERGEADIAEPEFWMHQLAVDHAPRLDPGGWRQRIGEMLGAGGT